MTDSRRVLRERWASLKAPAKTAIAIGATVVTAATIAIPVIASMNARPTTVETISVAPQAEAPAPLVAPIGVNFVKGNVSVYGPGGPPYYWLVPSDAPWETFPLMATQANGCDEGQLAWLRENGIDPSTVVQGLMTMDLRNDATDGGSMTVTNIRVEGEMVDPDVVLIYVTCQGYGAGSGPQVISLDFSGAPAVWAEPSSDAVGESKPAGQIASIDLAAGQLEQLFVLLPDDQAGIFEGDIVADVVVGTEEGTTTLVSSMRAIPKPFALFKLDPALSTSSFECRVGDDANSRLVPCLPGEIAGLIASVR